jgi:hypothetical protein
MHDRIGKGTRTSSSSPGAGALLDHRTPGKRTLTERLPHQKAGGRTSAMSSLATSRGAATVTAGHAALGHAEETNQSESDGLPNKLSHHLGVFDGMLAFERGLARFLLNVAPNPRDAAELKLEASVSVDGIFAKLTLEAAVEHGDDDFTLSGKVATEFGLGEESEGGGAELGVQEKKGLELIGPNPLVCIRQIGLYVDLWLREQQWKPSSFRDPRKWLQLAEIVYKPDAVKIATLVAGEMIADLLFGRGFQKQVVNQMTEGNQIESTRTLGIHSGVTLGSGEDGGVGFKGDAEFGVEQRTTWIKGADGDLEVEKADGFTAGLELEVEFGGVAVKVKGELFRIVGDEPELELEVALEVDAGEMDLVQRMRGALAMTQTTLLAQLAGGKMDAGDLLGQILGREARSAVELCALATGVANRVGIRLEYDGGEVVASTYVGAEHEEKSGVVNVSIDAKSLHEVRRWRVMRTGKALHR